MILSSPRPKVDQAKGIDSVGANLICVGNSTGLGLYFGLDGIKPTLPGAAVSFVLADFCLIKRQHQLPPVRGELLQDSAALALEQFNHAAAFRFSAIGQSISGLFEQLVTAAPQVWQEIDNIEPRRFRKSRLHLFSNAETPRLV